MNQKKLAEVMKTQLLSMLKILSAIFDKYGEIEIDKSAIDNAEIGFHIIEDEKDGKYIIKKITGKSHVYYDLFKDENEN